MNRGINFKDAYHTVPVLKYTDSPHMGMVVSVYQTLLPIYTRNLKREEPKFFMSLSNRTVTLEVAM